MSSAGCIYGIDATLDGDLSIGRIGVLGGIMGVGAAPPVTVTDAQFKSMLDTAYATLELAKRGDKNADARLRAAISGSRAVTTTYKLSSTQNAAWEKLKTAYAALATPQAPALAASSSPTVQTPASTADSAALAQITATKSTEQAVIATTATNPAVAAQAAAKAEQYSQQSQQYATAATSTAAKSDKVEDRTAAQNAVEASNSTLANLMPSSAPGAPLGMSEYGPVVMVLGMLVLGAVILSDG